MAITYFLSFMHPGQCPACTSNLHIPGSVNLVEYPNWLAMRHECSGWFNKGGMLEVMGQYERGAYVGMTDDVEITCAACNHPLDYKQELVPVPDARHEE